MAVKKQQQHNSYIYITTCNFGCWSFIGEFSLILHEKKNEFGRRIQKDLFVPPNVAVRAPKSGKSTDDNHRTFLNEVLRPLIGRKFRLLLDA